VGDVIGMDGGAASPQGDLTIEAVKALARSRGLEVSDGKAEGPPAIHIGRSFTELGMETALNCRGAGIYRMGERVVTVDFSGKVKEMRADRFRSWVEPFVVFYARREKGADGATGKPIQVQLKLELAKAILDSDGFRQKLPELRRVNQVRIPVRRKAKGGEEQGKVELLPVGYDEESMTYTARAGLDYEEDMGIDAAKDYIEGLLEGFPWGDEGRSKAVQVAAMLGVYCSALMEENVAKPMMFYNANSPGSGKSLLATMAITVVHGEIGASGFGKEEELKKELDAKAQAFVPVVFLDDVSRKGKIWSNTLNAFIVAPFWTGRVLRTSDEFTVPRVAQVFMTANGGELSNDLARRSLIVDLFAEESPLEREHKRVLDALWFQRPANRKAILAALWALVRHWVAEGEPLAKGVGGFERWTETLGGIVKCARFADPLEPPELDDAGGVEYQSWKRLMEAMVREMDGVPEKAFLLGEYAEKARELGLWYDEIGDGEGNYSLMEAKKLSPKIPMADPAFSDDPSDEEKQRLAMQYMERGQATTFAKILHGYRARKFAAGGRRYQFARRKARHSSFVIRALQDA